MNVLASYELHQHLECLVVFVLFGLSYSHLHAKLFDIVVIDVVGFKYYFNNYA